nr:MAG TPA: hypothetical protein [Caudoviricetes sp.]
MLRGGQKISGNFLESFHWRIYIILFLFKMY